MRFFKTSLTLSILGFASAFISTPSAFIPRLSTSRPLASSSSLHMVAEDAKVILVTGASRGLGRAIAVELGSQGQKIIVNYAGSEDAAKETVEMVKAAGGDAVAVRANCECMIFHDCIVKEKSFRLRLVFFVKNRLVMSFIRCLCFFPFFGLQTFIISHKISNLHTTHVHIVSQCHSQHMHSKVETPMKSKTCSTPPPKHSAPSMSSSTTLESPKTVSSYA